MSQSFFGIDTLMDSEDLMSWLLLNPELDNFANNYNFSNPFSNTNTVQNSGTYEFPPFADVPPAATSQPSEAVYQNQPFTTTGNYPVQFSYNNMTNDNHNNGFSAISSAPSNMSLSSSHNRSSFDTTAEVSGFNLHATYPTAPPTQHNNAIPVGSSINGFQGKRVSSSASLTSGKVSTAPTPAPLLGSSSSSSKKRPRETIEDLEARVKELRAENEDLHTHYLNVTQRTTEVQKQRAEMEKMMDAKLAEIGDRDDGDQSELAKIVKQYTDLYADYGKCRQREVSFHLQQLEKLVVPTMTTKMCLWTLHQDQSFYQKNSPMFDILCRELELTSDQVEKILEKRERTSLLLSKLRESLDLIASLKTAIEKKHKCYDNICGRVQAAATPKQVVIFLRWIAKNANTLAKHIQGFSRSIQHIPNVEFVRTMTRQFHSATSSANTSVDTSANESKE